MHRVANSIESDESGRDGTDELVSCMIKESGGGGGERGGGEELRAEQGEREAQTAGRQTSTSLAERASPSLPPFLRYLHRTKGALLKEQLTEETGHPTITRGARTCAFATSASASGKRKIWKAI